MFPERTIFQFYTVAMVPFLVIGARRRAAHDRRATGGSAAPTTVGRAHGDDLPRGSCVLVSAFFYPAVDRHERAVRLLATAQLAAWLDLSEPSPSSSYSAASPATCSTSGSTRPDRCVRIAIDDAVRATPGTIATRSSTSCNCVGIARDQPQLHVAGAR